MLFTTFMIPDEVLTDYRLYEARVRALGLSELNGFKIRNVLSTVFDSSYGEQVISEIFDKNGDLLSPETRYELHRVVSSNVKDELVQYLRLYLERQLSCGWYEKVRSKLEDLHLSNILFPSYVMAHEGFRSSQERRFRNMRLYDWQSFDGTFGILALDYNHAWKKRNIFTVTGNNSAALSLKHFFGDVYEWKLYSEDKNTFYRLNSATRVEIFGNEIVDGVKKS